MTIVEEIRKKLHEIPELSGQETNTIKLIKNFILENTDLKIVDCETYFYAVHYEGEGLKNIAFRADMDAICGQEGAYHGCGHDGHSAVLVGLALRIDKMKFGKNIFLLFQPAEETGKGALECADMIEIEKIDEIFGWHNIPKYAEGQVLIKQGTFSCASKGSTMKFKGKQSHAAYPERGINPAFTIARLINYTNRIVNLPVYEDQVFITIVNVGIGSINFGISAGYGEISMTIRAHKLSDLDRLQNEVINYAFVDAKNENVEFTYSIFDEFPDTVNNKDLYVKVKGMLDDKRVEYKLMNEPMRWSEDFGYYGRKTKAFFYGIGVGENYPDLHTQEYEFNDNVIDKAVQIMINIAQID